MNDTIKLCYWLQGFAEIHRTKPTKAQWRNICKKITEHEVVDEEDEGFMKAAAFISWLAGFIDLVAPEAVTTAQWKTINEHLQLVFVKVTPEFDEDKTIDDYIKELKKATESWPPPHVKPPTDPWKDKPTPDFFPVKKDTYCCSKQNSNPILDTKLACRNFINT